MTLLPILVFVFVALVIGRVLPGRWRIWSVLFASLLAIFWLQPGMPIRNLDFWLPSASILLVLFAWTATQPEALHEVGGKKAVAAALGVVCLAVLIAGLPRYLGAACCLTPTRPPGIERIALFWAAGIGIALLLLAWRNKRLLSLAAIIFILVLFVILKSPAAAAGASAWLRGITGQDAALASPSDLAWLGFSFLAFRLLHTLIDFRAGKLPGYRLEEFMAYALFFPAQTAGPIDRIQRFNSDLHQPKGLPDPNTFIGLRRIIVGIFKKFVLADTLALIAISGQNAQQIHSTFWLWLVLYAYALRIYFDFSGYTDIAIGIGNLMGINLPENFDRPYIKQNLTAFWNSWHMTLAAWFRAYVFNPLTRSLRSRQAAPPAWLIILLGQLATMLLIGVWHGLTWNFAIWGLWHGIGLFIHNRWTAWIRPRWPSLEGKPVQSKVLSLSGWFLTFNYVTLGWVWFALPSPELSAQVIQRLVGLSQ